MPMLRALSRASRWNTSPHVCLCCRLRLAQWQQTRGYSSAVVLQEYDDDWVSSFNNIDAESQVNEGEDTGRIRQAKGPDERDATDEDGSPITRRETRRQRIAARESTPNFESLKDRLESRLDQGNANPSADAVSTPCQPFAIIQEIKADFLAQLPQIMRGTAMKGTQGSENAPPHDVRAGQPIPTPEERSAYVVPIRKHSSGDWFWCNPSGSRAIDEIHKQNVPTEVEKLEEPPSRKSYPDAVQTAFRYAHSPAPASTLEGEVRKFWRILSPVERQTASVASANVSNSQSTASVHDSPDAAQPSAVKSDASSNNASSNFVDKAAQEQNFLAGISTLEAGTAEAAEVDDSPTSPLTVLSRFHAAASPFREDTKVVNSIAEKSESTMTPVTSTLLSVDRLSTLSRRDGMLLFQNTSKRSMSSTAHRRTPPASDVEPGTALGSSTPSLPPWEIAASGGKSAGPDIQQSSEDAGQPFLSLLPNTKQKKSPLAAKSDTKEKKGTSKKRVKSVPTSSDSIAEALQRVLPKQQGKKASGASEKPVKKTKAQPSDEKQTEEKQVRSVKAAKQRKARAPGREVEEEAVPKKKAELVVDSGDASPKSEPRTRRARTFRKQIGLSIRKQMGLSTRKHMGTFRKLAASSQKQMASKERVGFSIPRRKRSIHQAVEPGARAANEAIETRTLDSLQHELSRALSAREASAVVSIDAANLAITPLNLSQPPVPGLQYGLDRTLFNPGVVQLQDPHSRVFNFDPYLQKIMPVRDFDYNALKQYKTSSQDTALADLAKEHGKRYIGSTSSMTGTLGHFHYLISAFRSLDLNILSRSFPDRLETFTKINRAPNAIFLRKKGDGVYAIDADKEYDGPNVLMLLGKSMEKLLTLPKADYERYRKQNSHEVTEDERTAPEAFEYTTMGSFLMRSQLDAHDSRLPGNGMFDLKTRAVVSVRMNTDDYEPMTGYEIQTLQGRFQSYEREYYDMMRSTMLKYMLQVRMGRMDGIFLAYHNVERIFGFQYVPLHEMDRALHGQTDPALGNQEFKLSLDLLNKALDKATAKFPDQSLRLHFETSEEQIGSGSPTVMMWIFAEPMAEDEIDQIQSASHERTAEFERNMMGIEGDEPDDVENAESDPSASIAASEEETAAPVSSEAHSTTTSNAAPMSAAASEESPELKPLFSASIVCKSRVNGAVVQSPKFLGPEDQWELEYLLQEWDTDGKMWARYEGMKGRRKRVFEEKDLKDKQGESEGRGRIEKRKANYVDFLKSMSERGRAFRDKMDELDAGKVPVVVGQPLYASEGAIEKSIAGVDDYLGWLYGGQTHAAQESS